MVCSHPLGNGSSMWMRLGSLNHKPINKFFWAISIALIQQYNLLLKVTRTMVLFPSWIPWLYPRQTIPSLLQSTASPPILTNTYSEIAIIYLAARYSVIGTLTHRANTVCTTPELLSEELEHLREALVKCKYTRWALNKIQK